MLIFVLLSAIKPMAQKYQTVLYNNSMDFKFPNEVDSTQIDFALQSLQNKYLSKGYINFSVDSIIWRIKHVHIYLYTGAAYKISSILLDSSSQVYSAMSNRYIKQILDTGTSNLLAYNILSNMENDGYPFAKVSIQTQMLESSVEYSIQISKGQLFVFDTAHIDGDYVVKKAFLEAYTGIKSGTPYNESLYRKAHNKLNQLPFLRSEHVPQIAFVYGGLAKPFYYLKKRKSDQLNGIVGLAPTSNSNGSQTLQLTGEVVLKLNNLFKSAKMLSINWRSFKARSQELNTSFNFPYILYKPIGADFSLNFVKFDTLYTSFRTRVGFQYYTSGVNGLKFFYQISGTNLNTVDTTQIRVSKQFPNINAIQLKQYGINGVFNLLDYRFNPRSGWLIDAEGIAGTKTIQRDNQIALVKFGSEQYTLYDSTQLKTNQFQVRINLEKYFPLGERACFKLGMYTAQTISQQVYFNELFREGGINSLKGFNEQSIFANNFNMLDLEYRYLVGLNSHIKVFWNGAYYEDNSFGRTSKLTDTPFGFGVGGNIETSAGILSIMYALGKQKGNPIDIRNGKVHFGLSSYF
jgi:outer membrane translocation and assembly module TamA